MSTEQNKSAKLEGAGGEWQEKTFSQLGKIVTGKTPPSAVSGFFGGNIPFVTPTDFDERRFISSTKRYLTEKGADSINSSRIPNMAIMISCIGSDMGKVAISETECFTNQQINSIIVEPDNNPIFIYYNLSNRKLEIRSVAGGSAQPILNKSAFGELNIILPPLEEQRAIAHILGTLDDKIELNRRTNETLEAMTQALFKFWFVDFGPVRAKMEGRWRRGQSLPGLPAHLFDLFPDRLVDSELGEIPEGWEIQRIGDVAEKIAMGPFGSSIKVSTFTSSGIPIISGRHLNNTLLEDNTYNFIAEEHAEKLRNSNAYRGDIIFTHAGNIGQVSYIPESSRYTKYILSQRQFFLRCNPKKITPFFLIYYFRSPDGQNKILANTSSTGVPSISRPASYLRTIQFLCPPKDVVDNFSNVVKNSHKKIGELLAETKILAIIRDTLLPKLISGELRVKDTEKIIGRTP